MNKKLIQSVCYVAVAAVLCGFSIKSNLEEKAKEDQFAESMKQAAESMSSSSTASKSSEDTEEKEDKSSTKSSAKSSSSSKSSSAEKATSASETESSQSEEVDPNAAEVSTDAGENMVVKGGPYYSYLVTVDEGSLVMYSSQDNRDEIANIPSGYVGYVIEKTDDHRSLVIYKGIVGYCSNMYLEMTEITPEEFPDELVGVSAENAGSVLFNGAAVGSIENSNVEE